MSKVTPQVIIPLKQYEELVEQRGASITLLKDFVAAQRLFYLELMVLLNAHKIEYKEGKEHKKIMELYGNSRNEGIFIGFNRETGQPALNEE